LPDCEVPPLGTPQLDPLCNAGTVVSGVIDDQMAKVQDAITTWIGEALAAGLKALSTAWINIGSPGLVIGRADSQNPSETVEFLKNGTAYFAGFFLLLAMAFAMARMAYENKYEHGKGFFEGLGRFIVASFLGASIVSILVFAAGEYSVWIIDQATPSLEQGLAQMVLDTGGLAFFLIIIFGVLALLTTLIQIFLLIWRAGALVILTGTIGLSAAASSSEFGKQWFAKHVGWLLAYILYMPAAATIYAAAFKLIGASDYTYDDTKTIEHIAGLALLSLAILALPAMLRLVVPATQTLASGGGLAGVAVGAAAVAVPLGAAAMAGAGAGGAAAAANNSGGGGGGNTPPGAGPTGGGGTGPLPSGGGPSGSIAGAPDEPSDPPAYSWGRPSSAA
jgi:type IV secretion system protein TrbL